MANAQKSCCAPPKWTLKDFDEIGKAKWEIKELFDELDLDKNGKISKAEIKKAAKCKMELGLSDIDDDGEVSFDEFWGLMKNTYYSHLPSAEEAMADYVGFQRYQFRNKFHRMDTDGSGTLSMSECYSYEGEQGFFLNNFRNADNDDRKMTFDEMWAFVRDDMFADVSEEVNLRAFFKECDEDGSGFLTAEEVYASAYLKKNEELAKYLDESMKSDTNGDGKICIHEFLDHWRKEKLKEKMPVAAKESDLRAFFKKIDTDKSGFLNTREIMSALMEYPDEDLTKYLDEYMKNDKNKDGKICVEEFLSNWRKEEKKKQKPATKK